MLVGCGAAITLVTLAFCASVDPVCAHPHDPPCLVSPSSGKPFRSFGLFSAAAQRAERILRALSGHAPVYTAGLAL